MNKNAYMDQDANGEAEGVVFPSAARGIIQFVSAPTA